MISRVLWLRRILRGRERWSVARPAEHQGRRLALLREHAYARSPFRRRFHQGLDHAPLAESPVLTKATLMDRFDGVFLTVAAAMSLRRAVVSAMHQVQPGAVLLGGDLAACVPLRRRLLRGRQRSGHHAGPAHMAGGGRSGDLRPLLLEELVG